MHRVRFVVATSCCLLLSFFLGSCKQAPTTDTVVTKAESPNRKHLAVLVDRYYHAALMSDEFFLIVMPSDQNIKKATTANNIDKQSVLIATWASKGRLLWRDDNTLVAVCNSCGLKAIDIDRKLDHLGNIKIIYQGFPKHTAYQ